MQAFEHVETGSNLEASNGPGAGRPEAPTAASKGGKGKGVGAKALPEDLTPAPETKPADEGTNASPGEQQKPALKEEPAEKAVAEAASDLPASKPTKSTPRMPEQAIPEPPPALTDCAVDRRLRRIMQPRTNGEFKVPMEVVENWRDHEKRSQVKLMFEKAGYHPVGLLMTASCLLLIFVICPLNTQLCDPSRSCLSSVSVVSMRRSKSRRCRLIISL